MGGCNSTAPAPALEPVRRRNSARRSSKELRPPGLEELLGHWRCEADGFELTLVKRGEGLLHCTTSANKTSLLQADGDVYSGAEVFWNTGTPVYVQMRRRGIGLERRKWNVSTGGWLAPSALRRLTAEEAASRGRYVALAPLWEAAGAGHTVLLKGSWLVELGRTTALLPRRQDLPPCAVWDGAQLRRAVEAGTVRVLALSYCWAEPGHPDPQGEHLRSVAALIERRLAYTFPDGTRVLDDLAVFWDYSSLPQIPRSRAEQEAFDKGLSSVNLWYAHLSTEAWLLTRAPQGSKAYGERGWPVFERAVSSLVKPQDSFLDVGLWEGGHEDWSAVARKCKAQREPPLRPERAAAMLATKTFTSSVDFGKVLHIYERTYHEVLGSVRSLVFGNVKNWGDREAEALAECLPDCPQLEELDLNYGHIGAAGAAALGAVASQCSRLRAVYMERNPLGDEGAAALMRGLVGCPALELLSLSSTGAGDLGADAVAAEMPHCKALRRLYVNDCCITDMGAAALGSVLVECSALEKLEIPRNRLSEKGKAALKAAWSRTGRDPFYCLV